MVPWVKNFFGTVIGAKAIRCLAVAATDAGSLDQSVSSAAPRDLDERESEHDTGFEAAALEAGSLRL